MMPSLPTTPQVPTQALHGIPDLRAKWWYIPLVFVSLTGGVWVTALFFVSKWALMESLHLAHYVSGFAAICFLSAALAHFLSHRSHSQSQHAAEQMEGRRGVRSVLRRWLGLAALAGLAVGSESAVHWAADDVHHHFMKRLPGPDELYINHDITKLVGQTIQVMILKARDEIGVKSESAKLTSIAEVVPKQWAILVEKRDGRITGLTEKELWKFIKDPERAALDRGDWTTLLADWSVVCKIEPLSNETRDTVASHLSKMFAFAWREALKHDFEYGGKGWAAMQLDIMGQLLTRSTAGASASDPEIKTALAGIAANMPALDGLIAEVRLEQSRYHNDVVARLVDIHNRLADIAKDVRMGRDAAEAALREIGVQKRIMGALLRKLANGMLIVDFDADALATDDDTFQAILLLSQPQAGSIDQPPRRVELTPSVRAFVEKMTNNASLLDQQRAQVALGNLDSADALDIEYEKQVAEQRAQEDYLRATTRGDRYWLAENYDEAAGWYRKALSIQKDDPDVLNKGAMSLLKSREAVSYGTDVDQAEEWFTAALDSRRRVFLGDNPDVALSLNNLAYVRESLGRAAEAEPIYVQALEMKQRIYKGDHSEVALSLNNLAAVRMSLGRAAAAEPIFVQALEMRQRIYKGDHPDVASSLNNLAFVQQSLGRAAEAEPIHVQALEMYQRIYKSDHPDVAKSLNNLAIVRVSLGRAAEAEPIYLQALEMNQRIYKGDHADVATSLNNLAVVRATLGRAAEALPLAAEAVAMGERVLPPNHPNLGAYRKTLADCKAALQK